MTYRIGQRIVLVHTDDPFTDLHPGDTGTVTCVDGQQLTVAVSWDSGSELSMCLDAGDRIRVIAEPAPTVDPSAPVDTAAEATDHRHPRWGQVLDALRLLGAEAGRTAAGWWAQDSVGARAGGDTAATSRKVLAGIDGGDPAVLDTLPTVDLPVTDDEPDFYTAVVGDDTRLWSDLTVTERQEVIDAYRDGADSALIDRVTEHCRLVADPTGDGRDPHHLHPDDPRPSAGPTEDPHRRPGVLLTLLNSDGSRDAPRIRYVHAGLDGQHAEDQAAPSPTTSPDGGPTADVPPQPATVPDEDNAPYTEP